jgi:uncharacterized membrane protein
MNRVASSLAFAFILLLSLYIATVSLRYALPEPEIPPNVGANAFADPVLLFHAVTASVALLIGPLQFFRHKSGRRAWWHRLTGPIYALACLASAPGGLLLAIGTTAGPVAATGFGLLAVVWFWTTARGVQAVLAGRYAEHGRWMVRSFACTFAAVVLRLYLPICFKLGVDMGFAYVSIAWLCWIPNLIVAELILMAGRAKPAATPQAA